jgi:hypothetical protein
MIVLAAASGLWLLFNLVAMPLAWGGVNARDGVLWAIQSGILVGFLLVLFFDLASIGWLFRRNRAQGGTGLDPLHLFAGVTLVAMMGAKVMVDEIARETPLNGAGGEWGILYALLILQLTYIIVVLFRAKSTKA